MEIIGNKYIILEEIGNGGQANVFLVRDIQDEKLLYAAKLYKENIPLEYIEKEIKILKYLTNKKNEYITKYIDEVVEKNRKYIIIDYANKGSLFNYIDISQGFKESYGKLLFKKILIGVKECHDAKVCHRDLKSDNIILKGDNFNPLICDFGYSYYFENKFGMFTKKKVGTKKFNPPEMLMNKPYDGFKVDIFCLGIILFDLITNIYPFGSSKKRDENYSCIINNKYEEFWNKIGIKKNLTVEFKNLFLKMVSFKPKERPNIDEILNDDWFKEINNLEDNEMKNLENDLKDEFIRREQILKKETQIEKETNEESSLNINNRDSSEFKKIYFNDDLLPENIDSNIMEYMEHYIKIKGYLEGYMFMNCLANNLQEEKYEIEESDKNLEFNIIIRNQEEESEEQDEGENKEGKEENDGYDDDEEKKEKELIIEEKEYENEYSNDLIIQVKLFKIENKDKEHILRFLWESGSLKQYYEELKKVIDEAKKIL